MAKAHTKKSRRPKVLSTDSRAVTRRARLRQLMNERGANKLARELGYSNASFLSQMAGPNPIRDVTEKAARTYEQRLSLPVGYFEQPISDEPVPVAAGRVVQPVNGVEFTAYVIRMVRLVKPQ